jgi:DNA-binding PadR family transcriptional regulator
MQYWAMSITKHMTLPSYIILKFALKNSPFYGLQICKIVGLSPGGVYPILSRLGSAGLIVVDTVSELDRVSWDRRDRIYYQITETGKCEIMRYEKLLESVR